MPLALVFDCVSVPGFTPQPSHWFIQPESAWLSSPPGIIVKRTITALCVPVTASADSPEDLDLSAIRLQSVGFFLINCLDHILFWILHLIPRLRSDSWKLLFSCFLILNSGMREIISMLCSMTSTPAPSQPVFPRVPDLSAVVSVFIDSGADTEFMDESFARDHDIKLLPTSDTRNVLALDGYSINSSHYKTEGPPGYKSTTPTLTGKQRDFGLG
ncbi:uncharacterized protein LOC124868841 isoform X2 [Girardinichthys multiradiatus]|uniref:uncharacterized protein LOC124868841 isoform X2 n=1 Tax=Girardinichthys multiradiatus TaxID=208333 RepID=UPI001FACE441|nr:uncharacterized protein LOC124868841 isoform X2 [Girardinichthys multiradiatus]